MKYKAKHWREWIYERFEDKMKYSIHVEEDGLEYFVRSSNRKIKTQIYFRFMRKDDDDVLYDVQFNGGDDEKYNYWASPFTDDPKYKVKGLETSLFYTNEFVERLEKEWIYIPLKLGWTEEVYYLGKLIYKAKLKKRNPSSTYWDITEKYSYCLKIMDHLMIYLGIRTRVKQFKFEPIEK